MKKDYLWRSDKSGVFLESTYTPFAIIERENIFGSKRLIRANLLSNNGSSVNLSPNDTIYILSKKDVTF